MYHSGKRDSANYSGPTQFGASIPRRRQIAKARGLPAAARLLPRRSIHPSRELQMTRNANPRFAIAVARSITKMIEARGRYTASSEMCRNCPVLDDSSIQTRYESVLHLSEHDFYIH